MNDIKYFRSKESNYHSMWYVRMEFSDGLYKCDRWFPNGSNNYIKGGSVESRSIPYSFTDFIEITEEEFILEIL